MSDAVLARVDELRDELLDSVARAVRIPSVTPRYPGERYEDHVGREGEVSRLVAELYADAGCAVDVFALEPGRENAVGVLRGTGGGRSLIFNGHVDVVPPGPAAEWTGGDPWSGRVAAGSLHGRGSCDMKGGVVAQALAAVALRRAGVRLRGDLVLEAVVGEEMMEHALGTTACIERGYRADAAVVSEPSAPPVPLAVVPVTPGLLWFEVSVEGRATHTSMRGESIHAGGYGASVGVNAIDKAVLIYEALRRLEREWGQTKRHPLFRPGHFAIHPGVFIGAPSSGPVPFAIADAARIDYVVWHSPDESAEAVRAELEAHVHAAAQLDGWLREHPPRIEWKSRWPQSVVDPGHPIVTAARSAHEQAAGAPAVVAGFAAVHDAAFLTAAGIPAIGYGPGDLRDAHGIDEHVDVGELLTATRTYALLAMEWCGATVPRRGGARMDDGRSWSLASWATADGGAVRDLTGPLGCRHMELSEARIAPGGTDERAVRADVEQVHVVVAGRAELRAGDDRVEARALDAVLIPSDRACAIRALGDEPCRIVTIAAPLDGAPGPDAVQRIGWDDLADVDRHAPPEGYVHPWPTFEPYRSRVYDGVLAHARQSFVINQMEPGQSGQHHRHASAEEVHYLLRGSCRMRVGDEVLDVAEGEAVLVPPALLRSFSNEEGSGPCSWLVIGAPVDEFVEPGMTAYTAANDWRAGAPG